MRKLSMFYLFYTYVINLYISILYSLKKLLEILFKFIRM